MLSLEKVLLPVDFSERSKGAARYAKALATHAHSELTLLHVLEPPYVLGLPEGGGSVFAETRAAQVNEELGGFLKDELGGIPVQRIVLEGDPAYRIVEYAHSQQVGLVMMPTHGYGPLRRFILGSVTAKVLHDADCPVWTGVHAEEIPAAGEIPFDHIVCAVDLGRQSVKALCWAHRMASELDAMLSLVHVVPDVDTPPGRYFDPDLPTYLANMAQVELEKLQKTVGTHAEVFIRRGDPPKELRRAAQHLEAHLLVIGRSSEAGIFGRLRTNAYAIIRQAPCPVVSV